MRAKIRDSQRIAASCEERPLMLIRIFALAAICHGALACAASQIAPGIYLIEGEATPNRQPDGNSIVLTAPNGLIVFDTGRHKEHAQEILDFARAQKRPITAIINSHWHLDHVGGNPPLRAAYPDIRVYAGPGLDAALHGFLADYRSQLVEKIKGSPPNPKVQEFMRGEIALIDQGAAL